MGIQSSISSIQPNNSSHQHKLYIHNNSNTLSKETHIKYILDLLSTKIYQQGIEPYTKTIQQSSNTHWSILSINFIQDIKYIRLHIIYIS